MEDINSLELRLRVQKAETAKMELRYKIAKNLEENKRLEEHILLQDETIEKLKEQLAE